MQVTNNPLSRPEPAEGKGEPGFVLAILLEFLRKMNGEWSVVRSELQVARLLTTDY